MPGSGSLRRAKETLVNREAESNVNKWAGDKILLEQLTSINGNSTLSSSASPALRAPSTVHQVQNKASSRGGRPCAPSALSMVTAIDASSAWLLPSAIDDRLGDNAKQCVSKMKLPCRCAGSASFAVTSSSKSRSCRPKVEDILFQARRTFRAGQ